MIWKEQRSFKLGNVVTELFYLQQVCQMSFLLDVVYASENAEAK